MVALLVAAMLTAAPAPAPRAHEQADLSFYVPRMDQLGTLLDFFERAGEKSAVLRPQGWQSEFHPLLWLDFRRPESLTSAGIDPTGSHTLSLLGEARLACTTLTDPKAFEEKVGARLNALGDRSERKGKVRSVVSKTAGRTAAGYALQGLHVCAFSTPSNGETLLKEATRRVQSPSRGSHITLLKQLPPSALYVLSPQGVVGLQAAKHQLQLHSRSRNVPLPGMTVAATHPYGALTPSGLLFARGTVAKDALRGAVRHLADAVSSVCPACDKRVVNAAAETVASRLTGEFLLRVDRADLRGSLQSRAARFFALKHAFVGKLERTAGVSAALAKLGEKQGDGYVVSTPQGKLHFGLRAGHLYLANDEAALAAAFSQPPAPAPLAHGVEAVLDPKGVARALGQISLFDVMGSRELAGLFAASSELGPLLSASDRLTATVDTPSDGSHGVEVLWSFPE